MFADVVQLHDRTADPGVVRRDPRDAWARLGDITVTAPLGTVVHEIAVIAADVVPGAEDVCVAVLERGHACAVEFAGTRFAADLDERQHPDGYGPALTSAVTGQSIELGSPAAPTDPPTPIALGEFSHFGGLARRHGVSRVLALALPLAPRYLAAAAPGSERLASQVRASITFYSHGDRPEHAVADVAQAACRTIAATTLYASALAESAQLRGAMEHRAVIEQAKGIIMAGQRCTAQEAFEILREASMRSNRKLRDIAVSIVENAS